MGHYRFTANHYLPGDVEKSNVDFIKLHESIVDAILGMNGETLYAVKPAGLRERTFGELSSKSVRYCEKFRQPSDKEIVSIAERVADDVFTLWNDGNTPEEAMRKAEIDRFSNDHATERKGNIIYYSAATVQEATRKTKERTPLQSLSLVISYALTAWEAVCLDERDAHKAKYDSWLSEVYGG